MASELDMLTELPRLSWRGIVVPVLGGRDAEFAHENVQHKFLYKDDALTETLGARPLTFRYTIPFREGISKGPYRHLYLETFIKFFAACRDRTPGELVDPELGSFRALPTQWTSNIDVNRRDGTDVKVEFIHAPEQADTDIVQGGVQSVAAVTTNAGALDKAVDKVDWEQEKSPEPALDPLSAITAVGDQISFAADRISNRLQDTAFRLEKIEKAVDKLEHPENWPLKRSARRLRDAVTRLAERGANPEQRITTVITRYGKTSSAVAAEFGMTLQTLLQLNPALAKMPLIPGGTSVRRYG